LLGKEAQYADFAASGEAANATVIKKIKPNLLQQTRVFLPGAAPSSTE